MQEPVLRCPAVLRREVVPEVQQVEEEKEEDAGHEEVIGVT